MKTLLLSLALTLCLVTLTLASTLTVTDEVWFEVEVKDFDGPGEDYKGRFVMALFGEAAPMTVLNFISITRGYKRGGELLTYQNSTVHRIVPDFVVQMGDITVGDGTGGKSIFGERFNDEDFLLSHRSPGWVAMANHGRDTNGSQFYILLTKARWLDNKHVVFGKVIRGYDVVETLGEVESDKDTAKPHQTVTIVDCGVTTLDHKYEFPEEYLDSIEDL